MTRYIQFPPGVRVGLAMSVIMTTYGIIAGYLATSLWGPRGVLVSALSGLILGTCLQVLIFKMIR